MTLFQRLIGCFCVISLVFGAMNSTYAQVSEQASAPVTEHTYTLHELMQFALKHAPVIKEHQAKVEQAQWQSYRAQRAWTPKIESTSLLAPVPANADPSRIDENIDEILRFNIGPYFRQSLRLVMPIYTFGKMATAEDLAGVGIDVARSKDEQARQELLYQVQQAYYGLQLAHEFAALLGEGDRLIKEQLQEMEDARDFGEGEFSSADYRRLQIFSAEIDSRILDTNYLIDVANASIHYLTGIDSLPIAVSPLDTSKPSHGLQALAFYVNKALQARPEVQQLNRAVEARRLQRQLARNNYFPDIFVAADFGFGWSTEDVALQRICERSSENEPCIDRDNLFARPYSNPFDTLTFGVAVGMNWRFDFSQLRGRYKHVNAQLQETIAQRERALGAITLEITKNYQDALRAEEKIKTQVRRLEAARRWRDQFGLTLQAGAGNMKDAIDPLRAYYEAQALYLEAYHDYYLAIASLHRASGVSLLTLAEEISE